MLNFVQTGKAITIPAAPVAVASGAAMLVGSLFGVATDAAAQGAEVVIMTTGVFTLPKVSAMAFNIGDPVYWDNTAMLVTSVATSNTRIGVAVTAAANPSALVNVRLNGSF
jgi:predicted RecA/RadA family phage recombinase